jgi:hypothetical protein
MQPSWPQLPDGQAGTKVRSPAFIHLRRIAMRHRLSRFALTITLALALCGSAAARGSSPSQASGAASAASVLSGAVTAGAIGEVAQGSGRLVVIGLESAGNSTAMVLRDASGAAAGSARIVVDAVAAAGVAIGSMVEVAAESTGHVLLASGKAIAFIPNEIGMSLLGSATTRSRP